MAKLIPYNKNNSSLVKPSKITSSSLVIKKPNVIGAKIGAGENILFSIQKKVIKIDKLLKDSLALKKKDVEKKRITAEKTEFKKREEDLEKQKPKGIKGINLPSPPKLGIFDWIKNFIFNTLLGFIFVRLIDHLPKLIKLMPIIFKAGEFIIDIGGKLLDGLVTFIDWGYKAYDATKGFVKNLFGEDGAKQFDNLMGVLNQLSNVIILASLAAAMPGGPGGGGRGGGRRGGRFGSGGYRNGVRTEQYNGFNRRVSRGGTLLTKTGGTLWGQRVEKGGLGDDIGRSMVKSEKDIMKRYFQRYGRDKFIQRFGEAGLESLPGGMRRGLLQRGARSAFTGLLGKGGAKAILGFTKPFLKRLPIIGGLIDFGLSVALGEDPGRAAFKAIGAAILGTIGTAIGSLAFGFGGIVGGILGSIGGDAIGGALYDAFFKNKNPEEKKQDVVKAAGGGQPATRGGKPVSGPAKRTIKKKKAQRTLRATPPKLRPGSMVGGEKKIKQIYPESKDKTKMMSPFDFIKQSYENYSKSTGLGALAALAIKPLMGDKPSYADYKNAGTGVNNWMNQSIASGTLAYAGGGEVEMESIVSGEDYSDVIAKSLQDSVAPQTDKIIQDLMKQLMLKPQEVEKEKKVTEPSPGEDLGGDATEMVGGARLLMASGFPPLAAAVLSSVIQAESTWKGQRTPWVLNDGAGTNKGLISWNRSRIVNAEKFLGKPLETASNAEQIRWIKEELKQYGLLDDMMNSQATEEQLKQSIYKYVRWDRRYDHDHWKNISRIRTAIERGEQGSYVAGSTSGPGTPTAVGKGQVVQWLHGNPNRPGYDYAGHGTQSTAHDHFSFKSRGAAVAAFNALEKAGYKPWQFEGFNRQGDGGNAGGQGAHSASGGHYGPVGGRPTYNKLDDGHALDIPWATYGSGAIGPRDYAKSDRAAKIVGALAFHGENFGIVPYDNFILKLHKGEIYKVVDKDSVDLLGFDLTKEIIDIENKSQLIAKAPSIIEKLKAISGYTDYEQPYPEPEVEYVEVPVEVPVPMPMGGGGYYGVGGGSIDNSDYETLEMV